MKKRILSLIMLTTLAIELTACGNPTESNDSKQVAELESQVAELQRQLEETKQDQSVESTNSSFDLETQQLIEYTAGNAEYQGVCGADAKWYYKDNILVIRGTGKITDNPWQNDSNNMLDINWLIIDDGITAIDNGGSFSDEKDLAKVVLPSTLEKIGEYTFSYCDNLTSIIIPDSVTEIGQSAFAQCKSLTDINIPMGVTIIESFLFDGCSSLTSVTISDGVTEIGPCAFENCESLITIIIPDSVTKIQGHAFKYCDSLDDSTIQKINSIRPNTFPTN